MTRWLIVISGNHVWVRSLLWVSFCCGSSFIDPRAVTTSFILLHYPLSSERLSRRVHCLGTSSRVGSQTLSGCLRPEILVSSKDFQCYTRTRSRNASAPRHIPAAGRLSRRSSMATYVLNLQAKQGQLLP